jgi:hypothetical protein
VNEATELIWHEFRGNGLRNMSLSDRRLVQSVALDLFKVLPALLLVMMPGGGVVIGAVTRLLPQALPSTFQGAPQWEKYYQVDALQRDIVRKFRADRVAEREVDDLYLAFVTASDTMWRLPDAAVNPFGDALDDALEHKVDDIQPRSVHDRLTPEQLGIVCTALGIQAEKVMVAWPHRLVAMHTRCMHGSTAGGAGEERSREQPTADQHRPPSLDFARTAGTSREQQRWWNRDSKVCVTSFPRCRFCVHGHCSRAECQR